MWETSDIKPAVAPRKASRKKLAERGVPQPVAHGALSHIRVLDLSRVLAGPWATQLLGDLGAEVIKIERPGHGDDTRTYGPPWVKDEAGEETGLSAYYSCANRNKESITIDFTRPAGQALVRQLAEQSDVLVENFKVGTLARYGLDYATLAKINPRLIYCSITGFGQDGPYAERSGYDFLIQGMGGLMSITGAPNGTPTKVGVALTDVMTGLYASNAILAALAWRERSGEGQHIDLGMLDVQIAALANQASNYLATGVAPPRIGNAHPNIVPYDACPTADGHMILAVGNDAQFARFCMEAGTDWLADSRFGTNAARVKHRDILIPLVHEVTRTRSTAEWVSALEAAGVPCGPINDICQVFDDPHVRHRGMRVEIPHPQTGTVPVVRNPIRMSKTPATYRRPPPGLGSDTRELLERLLGKEADAIDALSRDRVI
ncbi:CaiB/BaiF CoA-transferase family protein [Niveibacterium umoris]|uniref:Crotonobetainyl-CoA:carnitine CoA-transferase CaiB-like acyl-CoA transferase n=1 Tax=Niveibacterium umoris TaxID=1193620 RepID=A0A840BF68_9RHOO|nr:CaiB/BaiF CoA-transferase family protein [Niveibacterium umoris]MBB4011313.1 crotonobetainyl-CoA:carnitine CoA-transferase CaiB-like acyl-CoA transferase [Niveibacterium umoris]